MEFFPHYFHLTSLLKVVNDPKQSFPDLETVKKSGDNYSLQADFFTNSSHVIAVDLVKFGLNCKS